uniref:Uncharacterized protein n=1 Tax=Ascaris lumbricoides TaxID=6252 RepID=A0A0M3HKL8_ASCLU
MIMAIFYKYSHNPYRIDQHFLLKLFNDIIFMDSVRVTSKRCLMQLKGNKRNVER